MARIAHRNIDFDAFGLFAASNNGDRPSVRELARRRGLTCLVHFTHADNLAGIFEQGLLQRELLDQYDIGHPVHINDELRCDNRRDSVSLSIAHPNHSMFYKYRSRQERSDWVVLVLDRAILWEKECGFFPTNAASNSVRFRPLEDFQGADALEAMFYDGPQRLTQGLNSHDPTDHQAEVMVFDCIEPRYLLGVCFESPWQVERHQALLRASAVSHAVEKELFWNRSYARQRGYAGKR